MSKLLIPYFLFYTFIIFSIFSESKLVFQENTQKIPSTIRLTLNGNNLGDIEKIAIEKLLKEQDIILEPINVTEEIDILGKLDLYLNNTTIKITNSTDAEISLSFAEKENINFILNILHGIITFDYYFYTGLISGEGNATIYVKNLSLSLNNKIIQVPNEYEPEKKGPGLEIEGIVFNDLDMDLYFSKNGTLEKFLKYFNKNLKNIILKIAEYEVNRNDILQKINSLLFDLFKSIKLNIPIENLLQVEDNVNISFSMNEEPMIKNNVLEISFEAELKGQHYNYENYTITKIPHLVNNSELLSEKTINGAIGQFIINNVLDVLFFFGKLNFVITNDTLSLPEINVGTISAIIPEITKGYAASQKVKIYANALDNPVLKINENNKLNLKIIVNLKFFIYNETQYFDEDIGTIPIDADSQIDIEADFFFNDTNIQLTLTSVSMITFEVKNSLVGEINTERVKTNFKTFMSFMIGNINKSINNAIQNLPKPFNILDINLNELVIQSYEDYLKFDLSPIIASLNNII